MIKKIGITGPSGSGKSLLCDAFRDAGIPCIDADKLYHSMLIPPSKCLDAIATAFGNDLLNDDGTLNRAALASKVFSCTKQLEKLNNTVLPIVIDKIQEIIDNFELEGHKAVAIDAPTLIESGFYRECDINVVVTAPKDTRITRISQRDGIDTGKARQRVAAQHTDDFYTVIADFVIINDLDKNAFKKKSDALVTNIKTTL
jgi:dephospho-CoA kinase